MTEVAGRHPPHDLRWAEKFPAFILLAALLFIGFWPKSMSEPINATLGTMTFSERTAVPKVAAQ
jgi:NADH-quinone oxidoreductase subunit M